MKEKAESQATTRRKRVTVWGVVTPDEKFTVETREKWDYRSDHTDEIETIGVFAEIGLSDYLRIWKAVKIREVAAPTNAHDAVKLLMETNEWPTYAAEIIGEKE